MAAATHSRRYPIGPQLDEYGASFRVWAPEGHSVEMVLEESGEAHPLTREETGHFSIHLPNVFAGTLYRFRLDHSETLYPDPASHYQPDGPHGPSQLVDHNSFKWHDQDWRGISPAGQVLYEMHIGTFTHEGTWAAAASHLPYLKELGITCIEMMPVADFPGLWGWGYDGVDLFAPTRLYGRPDDLKAFIDEAHRLGLGVILDVVYNHLGPDGNYLTEFSPWYLSKTHRNDWGQSINFDGESSRFVREFYLTNAIYWIREYHFDGFRFDATQAIIDESSEHILAAISRETRAAAAPRGIYLICENEAQNPTAVRPKDRGGYGMDALWNDDFHHSAMVALTGRNEAYYTDYLGEPQELLSSAKWGYLYQGQIYRWQQRRRGSPALDLPPTAYVHYLQNHDQVANYAMGCRAHQLAGLAQYRAMTALLILMPQTPLLFQGQEYAANQPFYFFSDHNPSLAKLIRKGRAKEMSQFPSVAHHLLEILPDPCAEQTFLACKLDVNERDASPVSQCIYRLHRDLLRLRRDEKTFSRVQQRGNVDGAVLGPGCFVLRFFGENEDDRLLIVNLHRDLHLAVAPEPLLAPPDGKSWDTLWTSEHPDYGGTGAAALETEGEDWRLPGDNWTIRGHCTTVLKPCPRKQINFPPPRRVGLEEDEMQ